MVSPEEKLPKSQLMRRLRADRKRLAVCRWCAEPVAVKPNGKPAAMCVEHLAVEAERSATKREVLRAERRARGECESCGKPSNAGRCIRCSIYTRNLPVTLHATVTRQERNTVAAQATVIDKDGRSRYLGQQKKGAPSKAVLARQDAKDLRDAARELLKSADAIEASGGADWQSMPRIQRDAYKREILSYADFGVRMAESVLDRHGYGTEATERMEKKKGERNHMTETKMGGRSTHGSGPQQTDPRPSAR